MTSGDALDHASNCRDTPAMSAMHRNDMSWLWLPGKEMASA
jgi:hypothetical protein